ncbi:putative Phospholipid/glycerol acyltransferase domain-containing protein [Seiridium cardinale]|uniref:Phospholipid/glycerol acyltransferase domain-containing protein n=1 Tax=Seiridium cardinale TaxID=138064 RepID=A0ABR2Y2P4_9PEZI
MEKYSQFRDRGSGVSPFLPHVTPVSIPTRFWHMVIFCFRLPIFLFYVACYFLLLTHLPLPVVFRKLLLWGMLGIPGIWWVDLQLDGVKRGHLHEQPAERVPHPGSIIAAQFTSPIDALYLAAIFDPIFTISYPGTQKVQQISLLGAIFLALAPVRLQPPNRNRLTTLRKLREDYPHRVIAVFPECSTTNGKGLLPLSTSLLGAPADAKIFPISLRYTPQDITTPIPGTYFSFLWNLLSKPTHCIRVRIAEAVTNKAELSNGFEVLEDEGEEEYDDDEEPTTPEGRKLLDHIAETLARLARNKRVGLTLRDKAAFVEAWTKGRK